MTDSGTAPVLPDAPNFSPARWPGRRILPMLGLLGILYAFPVGMMPLYVGPTETAYAFPAIALYERGVTRIDAEVKRYWRHEDIIRRGKHHYSNKAPGMILLLCAAAPIVDLLLPGRLQMIQLVYFGRLLAVVLPFVGFLYVLGRALERLSTPRIAWGLVLAYALASGATVYATLLYTHNVVAALHGTALILLWRPTLRRAMLAGGLSAYGAVTEHLTIVLFAGLAILAWLHPAKEGRARTCVAMGLGALPPFLIMAVYNWATFGSPSSLSYTFDAYLRKSSVSRPVFSVTEIKFRSLYGLALSPSRGFAFHTPWLAMAFAALPAILKSASVKDRLPLLASLSMFGAMFLALSAFVAWPGGVSVGPRYLVAAYPLLLFPLAWWLVTPGPGRSGLVRGALLAGIGLSLVVHFVVIRTFPMTPWVPPAPFINTIAIYCLYYLRNGWGNYTVLNHFGMSIQTSSAVLVGLYAAVILAYALPARERLARAVTVSTLACVLGGMLLFWPWSNIGLRDEKVIRESLKFYRMYLYGYNRNTRPIRGW